MSTLKTQIFNSPIFYLHKKLHEKNQSITSKNITIYPLKVYQELLDAADDLSAIKENELLQSILWNHCMMDKTIAPTLAEECLGFFIEGESALSPDGLYPVNIIQSKSYLKTLMSIEQKINNGQIQTILHNVRHLSQEQQNFLSKKKPMMFQKLLIAFIKDKNDPQLKNVERTWDNILYLAQHNLLTVDYLKKDIWEALYYLLRNDIGVCLKHGLDLWLNHDTSKTMKFIQKNLFNLGWTSKKEVVSIFERLSHKNPQHYVLIHFLSHFNKDPLIYYKKITDLPNALVFGLLYKNPTIELQTPYKVPGDISFAEWKRLEGEMADVLGSKKTMKKEMFQKFMAYNNGVDMPIALEEMEVFFG